MANNFFLNNFKINNFFIGPLVTRNERQYLVWFILIKLLILNVIVISDSSESDFEGFLEGSFDVNVVERQHDTVNSDSNISLDENVSNGADHDENDMFNAQYNGNHEKIFRKNTVISVLFTLDMKFFLHFTTY